jgi:hypothetical protein
VLVRELEVAAAALLREQRRARIDRRVAGDVNLANICVTQTEIFVEEQTYG